LGASVVGGGAESIARASAAIAGTVHDDVDGLMDAFARASKAPQRGAITWTTRQFGSAFHRFSCSLRVSARWTSSYSAPSTGSSAVSHKKADRPTWLAQDPTKSTI
jgi:hypothetical protein